MPGGEFRVGDAINQQVAGAALGAGVFAGQAPPRQALFIVLTGFEGRGAARKGAFDQRLAFVVEHLYIDVEALFAFFQVGLGDLCATAFIQLSPALGEAVDSRVVVEYPGVLVEGRAQQQG